MLTLGAVLGLALLIATARGGSFEDRVADLTGLEAASCVPADSAESCTVSDAQGPVLERCYASTSGFLWSERLDAVTDCRLADTRDDVPDVIWDDVERELAPLVDSTRITFYAEATVETAASADSAPREQRVTGQLGRRTVVIVAVFPKGVRLPNWDSQRRTGTSPATAGTGWRAGQLVAWCESAALCAQLRARIGERRPA